MENLPPPSSVFHVRTGNQRNKDNEKWLPESFAKKNETCQKWNETNVSGILIKENVENDNMMTEIEFDKEKHFRILRWLSSIEIKATSNFSFKEGLKESRKLKKIDSKRR